MLLLIDNYDSFTYNLAQLMGAFDTVYVARNDALTLEQIEALDPAAIVLSPGPGRPENAGICVDVVRRFYKRVPILGVCLGHQAIAAAFGATIRPASSIVHGKAGRVDVCHPSVLFEGMKRFEAGRYHSLVVDDLPEELIASATGDGEIMAIEHTTYPVFGVQFHPESVLTPCGSQIFANFMKGVLA
ncbi:aminodeoxychorismate/anthranilate synthase component II [uncultured Dubosiella sp.]|uniref:anthranilate synthase component II n=1 Tax=uncultured Dubosiella sp. TaxID=1937011 RepID=UPI0025B5E74B|nr:aminodeoxychorismate/anthranilate synthase component II [uncultured Dubosiella sp.]